ncbi:MAG: hypothetical protein EXR75_04150 [Myxococcales bacterium]|nr:hypothetical protein [Myxococcales bacterium]
MKRNPSKQTYDASSGESFGQRGVGLALGHALICGALFAATGCTSVSFATLPQAQSRGELLITQEAMAGPYESKGVLQLTRKGAILFGFADVVGTDLESAIEELGPEIRSRGADGLVNMRVEQTQYSTFRRIVAILHFFAPLPAEVTINGELVKRIAAAPPAAEPAPAAEAVPPVEPVPKPAVPPAAKKKKGAK